MYLPPGATLHGPEVDLPTVVSNGGGMKFDMGFEEGHATASEIAWVNVLVQRSNTAARADWIITCSMAGQSDSIHVPCAPWGQPCSCIAQYDGLPRSPQYPCEHVPAKT